MAKKRILIVDDEQGIQLLYRGELEDEGYDVDSAYNGEEALEKFSAQPPDLVILDINMPGMNGIEVLRQMKELNAELPVILCSAYPEFKRDFGTWASEEYIVKSANIDELKAAVHKYTQ
ncbi:response regulator [Desulfogranum mediterraneum]|uniref:response regulator n=1 Tax=Desulfogranum mediterraneum TaxID=160661 RepID=UPI0003FEB43A|nr:response regulator [Desulfogranum mediterraneum]